MDNCLAPSSDGGGYGCDNMTVIIVALLHGKSREQWYDMIVDRVKEKDGPVAPKKFGTSLSSTPLIVARFLGPGFNQFQNWNQRNDESSDASDGEDALTENSKKPPTTQQDDNEGWTDWKNGDDFRNRFTRSKKPGRIIQLGDGSELFTDRTVGADGHDMTTSSEEEDESVESEDDHKMQVDGVVVSANTPATIPTKSTPPDADVGKPRTEIRHKSPTPTHDTGPGSPLSQK